MNEVLGSFQLLERYPLVLLLIVLWSLFWKGLALWQAARQGDRWWFVGLLAINSLGILEIVYLQFFAAKTKAV